MKFNDKDIINSLKFEFEPLRDSINISPRVAPPLAQTIATTYTKSKAYNRAIKASLLTCITSICIILAVLISNAITYKPETQNTNSNNIGTETGKNAFIDFCNYNDAESVFYYAQKDNAFVKSKSNTLTETETTAENISKTNVQTEGVDESSYIQNDGRYLYHLSQAADVIVEDYSYEDGYYSEETNEETRLNIFDTLTQSLVFSKIYKNETSLGLYLKDNYLISLSNHSEEIQVYGEYDYKDYIAVRIFDISDKSNIKEAKSYNFNAPYIETRLVGNTLYAVTQQYTDSNYDATDNNYEKYLPSYETNGKTYKANAQNTTIVKEAELETIQTIYQIKLDLLTDQLESTVSCGTNEIYMSNDFIYLYGTSRDYYRKKPYLVRLTGELASEFFGSKYKQYTTFIKYSIKNNKLEKVGSNTALGIVNDQFSLDESDGYFRIALTDDKANRLYVFDSNLKQVGLLKDIAPYESIKSCRFEGDKCYLVTYLETDPLFVIDLSDPKNPEIEGKLKIPGFSTYMHRLNDKYMLGIGYTDNRNYKISLFDVSDSKNPKESNARVILKEDGIDFYTDVTEDHTAFVLHEKNKELILPLSAQVYNTGKFKTYYGFLVIKEENGKIIIKEKVKSKYYKQKFYNIRSAYIGNTYYTLSAKSILIYNTKTGKNQEIKF